MTMDMSFGDGAGWGGDTSFATDTSGKDSETAKLSDKLPVPIVIADLAQLEEDKIAFGGMTFATAYTIGEVIGEMPDKGGWMLRDPANPDSTFGISTFDGVSDEATMDGSLNIQPGQIMFAVGKLRLKDGAVTILAYKMRHMDKDGEYACFVKEAQVARLFWEKNVISRLRNGESSLTGCAAGAPAPKDGATTAGGGGVATHSNNTPAPVRAASSVSSHRPATQSADMERKFGDKRDPVLHLLKEQAKKAAGNPNERKDLNIHFLVKAVQSDFNTVRDALDFLAQEGTIFCTVDDEHYEMV